MLSVNCVLLLFCVTDTCNFSLKIKSAAAAITITLEENIATPTAGDARSKSPAVSTGSVTSTNTFADAVLDPTFGSENVVWNAFGMHLECPWSASAHADRMQIVKTLQNSK